MASDLEARIIRLEQMVPSLFRRIRNSRNQSGQVLQALAGGAVRTSGDGVPTTVFSAACNAFYPMTLTLVAYGQTGSVTWDAGTSRYVGAIVYSDGTGTSVFPTCVPCISGGTTAIVFQINPANWNATIQFLPCAACSGLIATGIPPSLTGSNLFGPNTTTKSSLPSTRSCSPLNILWSILVDGWFASTSIRLTV